MNVARRHPEDDAGHSFPRQMNPSGVCPSAWPHRHLVRDPLLLCSLFPGRCFSRWPLRCRAAVVVVGGAGAAKGHRAKQRYVIAKHDTQVTAVIIPATAPDGYSGNIDLLVGIDAQSHEIIGVRVIAHKETPGLGDKIDVKKSDWIKQFAGLSLRSPNREYWEVKKNGGHFDAFTGATITPRAVVHQVANTLEFYEAEQEALSDIVDQSQPLSSDPSAGTEAAVSVTVSQPASSELK